MSVTHSNISNKFSHCLGTGAYLRQAQEINGDNLKNEAKRRFNRGGVL